MMSCARGNASIEEINQRDSVAFHSLTNYVWKVDEEIYQNNVAVQCDTNHTCEICEKVFNSKKKLKNPFILVHDNRGKLFDFNICTKCFEIQSKLTFHIKIFHERGKVHKCGPCGKSFSRAGNLKNHITKLNLVLNHFLLRDLWRDKYTPFMKAVKITNVNLVANHFFKEEI